MTKHHPKTGSTVDPTYEPEGHYEITLARKVPHPVIKDTFLSPGKRNVVKGKHISALGEAVTNATPV